MKQESCFFYIQAITERHCFPSYGGSLQTRLIAASFNLKWDINATKSYGLE